MCFCFPIPRGLTPLAGVVPTCEVGIERRAQGNVLSSAAVFVCRRGLGQWRQAAWNGEKYVKTPANPGFVEYRFTRGYPRRPCRDCVPTTSARGRGGTSFRADRCTTQKRQAQRTITPFHVPNDVCQKILSHPIFHYFLTGDSTITPSRSPRRVGESSAWNISVVVSPMRLVAVARRLKPHIADASGAMPSAASGRVIS